MIILENHKCDMCKCVAKQCFKMPGNIFCAECLLRHHPPTMTLATFDNNNRIIYNIEVGRYESVNSIETFEDCGWFIRSKQESLYRLMPRVTVNVYHLEYYGTYKCCRCKDHPAFASFGSIICQAAACVSFQEKKKPEDRNYPQERSKFYEYVKDFSA